MVSDRKNGLPRVFDVAFAICGLIVTAPVVLLAAILIRIEGKGPIVFRQLRIGKGKKAFTLFKLRSMYVGTEGALVTAARDKRVTRIGRLIRRTKIDELPELWNVIRGDMSIVGPRPEVPDLVNVNDPIWEEVLSVRPGLTDPVTLRLRNEEALLAHFREDEEFYSEILQPYKLQGYLRFISDRTWKTDLKVIFETCIAIVFPQTAKPPTVEEMQWFLLESKASGV